MMQSKEGQGLAAEVNSGQRPENFLSLAMRLPTCRDPSRAARTTGASGSPGTDVRFKMPVAVAYENNAGNHPAFWRIRFEIPFPRQDVQLRYKE